MSPLAAALAVSVAIDIPPAGVSPALVAFSAAPPGAEPVLSFDVGPVDAAPDPVEFVVAAAAAVVEAAVAEALSLALSVSFSPVPMMASFAAFGQALRRRARLRQAQSRTAQVGSRSQARVEGRIVSRRQFSG